MPSNCYNSNAVISADLFDACAPDPIGAFNSYAFDNFNHEPYYRACAIGQWRVDAMIERYEANLVATDRVQIYDSINDTSACRWSRLIFEMKAGQLFVIYDGPRQRIEVIGKESQSVEKTLLSWENTFRITTGNAVIVPDTFDYNRFTLATVSHLARSIYNKFVHTGHHRHTVMANHWYVEDMMECHENLLVGYYRVMNEGKLHYYRLCFEIIADNLYVFYNASKQRLTVLGRDRNAVANTAEEWLSRFTHFSMRGIVSLEE